MSEKHDFNLTKFDAEGNEIQKPHRAEFSGGVLTISMVNVDDQGVETLVPTMVQPFKTLSDGTRTEFVNAEDAFAWVDAMIGTVIN